MLAVQDDEIGAPVIYSHEIDRNEYIFVQFMWPEIYRIEIIDKCDATQKKTTATTQTQTLTISRQAERIASLHQ